MPMYQSNALFAMNQHERSRLNLQHRLFKKATGRNYFAQVRNPQRILDAGYGTGIWCMEIARQFERATVIGLGGDPVPFERAKQARLLPGNFHFVQGSLLRRLPFANDSFDYVHARFIACDVPVTRWPTMISDLVRVTRPGGWLELTGAEFPLATIGSLQAEFTQAIQALFARRQITLIGASLPGWLEQAGLTDLHSRRLMLRGKRLTKNLALAAQNLRLLFVQHGLFSAARFDGLISELYKEMRDNQVQLPVVVAWGVKPLADKQGRAKDGSSGIVMSEVAHTLSHP